MKFLPHFCISKVLNTFFFVRTLLIQLLNFFVLSLFHHPLHHFLPVHHHNRIPFSAASSATPYKRNFKLVYLSESNEHEEIELKLARPRIAIALYRSITEKHAFYSCETVGSDVTKQFIRDFKVRVNGPHNYY